MEKLKFISKKVLSVCEGGRIKQKVRNTDFRVMGTIASLIEIL